MLFSSALSLLPDDWHHIAWLHNFYRCVYSQMLLRIFLVPYHVTISNIFVLIEKDGSFNFIGSFFEKTVRKIQLPVLVIYPALIRRACEPNCIVKVLLVQPQLIYHIYDNPLPVKDLQVVLNKNWKGR